MFSKIILNIYTVSKIIFENKLITTEFFNRNQFATIAILSFGTISLCRRLPKQILTIDLIRKLYF